MNDDRPPAFILGELSADVKTLKNEMSQARSDITVIKTKLDIQHGGWKVLAWLTAAATAAGSIMTVLVEWITRHK